MPENSEFYFIDNIKSEINRFEQPGFLDNPINLWYAKSYLLGVRCIIDIYNDKKKEKEIINMPKSNILEQIGKIAGNLEQLCRENGIALKLYIHSDKENSTVFTYNIEC